MRYAVILNKKVWALFIIFVSIIAISTRYIFLTEKFFFDSTALLRLERIFNMTGNVPEGAFGVTAMVFSYINFFDFESLIEWSIYITCIFGVINFLLLKNIYVIELKKLLIILIALLLWYLFASGITKEVIQTLFYIAIYYFIFNDKIFKTTYSKVIIGIIILYLSSICFREYYILTAFFSGIVYMIYVFFKRKNIDGIKCYIFSIIFYLIILAIFLVIIEIVLPEEYITIVTLRSWGYQYLIESGTDSFIDNVIEGEGIYIYLLNYIINYFRLLVPIELLFGGKIYYIPFVIYQITFTYYYISNIFKITKINDKKFVCIVFITSFIAISTMMEPDFGSWVRHQSACYMLFISLLRE